MLDPEGAVKLLDFGIAKALSETNEPGTQLGTIRGKIGYSAPELIDGLNIDLRADLFAAGVVLHETLTGRRLFRAEDDAQALELVRAARVDPPSSLNPLVPPILDRICLHALARDRGERYQTGAEMAAGLAEALLELQFDYQRLRQELTLLAPALSPPSGGLRSEAGLRAGGVVQSGGQRDLGGTARTPSWLERTKLARPRPLPVDSTIVSSTPPVPDHPSRGRTSILLFAVLALGVIAGGTLAWRRARGQGRMPTAVAAQVPPTKRRVPPSPSPTPVATQPTEAVTDRPQSPHRHRIPTKEGPVHHHPADLQAGEVVNPFRR
jgi:serine/threonine-protein kinase